MNKEKRQSLVSQEPPSRLALARARVLRTKAELAMAGSVQEDRAREQAADEAARDAAQKREIALRPFVEKIRKGTEDYTGYFLYVAQKLEEQRIKNALQEMGSGGILGEYYINLKELAAGDKEQREILQGALMRTRAASQPQPLKTFRLAADIFSKKVDNIVDDLLADGMYTEKYSFAPRDRQIKTIQTRYRTQTIKGEGKIITPVEFFQDPERLRGRVSLVSNDHPRFTAGYVVRFNKVGDIIEVSDRYVYVDGKYVYTHNSGGDIQGSKGSNTTKFIKNNGANGDGFGNAGFIFGWNNLTTDPRFSINIRKGHNFNFFSDYIYSLDTHGRGRFVSTNRGYGNTFQVDPTFTNINTMLQESLKNVPMMPIQV